jgi:hypothetical protein
MIYKIKTFKEFISKNKKKEEFLYKKGIMFFFKYKNKVYGAKEEDRIIFSKIKLKDKDIDLQNTFFEAYDLKKYLIKKFDIKKFNYKDIKKIKIIQLEQAMKILLCQ